MSAQGRLGSIWYRVYGQFHRDARLILVTSPALGQEVGSPVLISGSANVFEANVSVKILDENDEVIAETFTTATCGTGCRGTYRVSVPYEVDHAQEEAVARPVDLDGVVAIDGPPLGGHEVVAEGGVGRHRRDPRRGDDTNLTHPSAQHLADMTRTRNEFIRPNQHGTDR